MEQNPIYKILAAMAIGTGGVIFGSLIGVSQACGLLNLATADEISSRTKVRIYSKQHEDKILKTFKTANGEISYLVDKLAATSIDEIIFYMESLNEKPLDANQIMAVYRVVDSDYDNKISLEETNPLKTEQAADYSIKSWGYLKNDKAKRY